MQTTTAPETTAVGNHVIDCDSSPFVPNNWTIIPNANPDRKKGQITWDKSRVKFYRSESQQNGRSIKGDYLEKELESKKVNVMDANVLHFLEKNPKEIPESFWPTGDAVSQSNVFWDTKPENGYGKRFVGCLVCFQHGMAQVSYSPIDHGFGYNDPAVIWE
jgi:hypothetical protein